MGAMSEDMLDGTCCALCGQYFDSGKTTEKGVSISYTHGSPVACHDCYEENCGYERAEKITF